MHGQECLSQELSLGSVKKNKAYDGTRLTGVEPAANWNDPLYIWRHLLRETEHLMIYQNPRDR